MAAEWLLQPGAKARSTAFLAAPVGGPLERHGTRGAALVRNLRYVVQSAASFAEAPAVAHLIGLKPGQIVGDWRDSGTGLGGSSTDDAGPFPHPLARESPCPVSPLMILGSLGTVLSTTAMLR